ncbi:MAG: hypothetical protein ABI646_03370 [Acidobacteriota bacterium]
MELFKRIVFVFLALHALVDLTFAVIAYRQVGNLAPSILPIGICVVFSFYLFPALRDEEFSKRWFPGKWFRGPINGPVAFWFTFAVLVLIHLILTGIWARVAYWYPN